MKNDIFNDSFCYIQTIEKNTNQYQIKTMLFIALNFEYVVLNIFYCRWSIGPLLES